MQYPFWKLFILMVDSPESNCRPLFIRHFQTVCCIMSKMFYVTYMLNGLHTVTDDDVKLTFG